MSVLLVNGPWITSKKSYIAQANEPLHLLSMAAVLEQQGIDCSVVDFLLDPYSEDSLVSHLKETRPRIVGVSSYTTNFFMNLDIARAVKRYDRSIHVVFGGAHPSALPEHVLGQECVDSVCVGEGERTMVELCEAVEGKRDMASVDGLWWKDQGRAVVNADREPIENLDELPIPARHKIPMERYYYGYWGRNCSLMMAGRGCPYRCVFCASRSVFQTTRFHSPKYVVDEIEHVQSTYGRTAFMFNDDTFTLKDKWINAFLDELERRELNIIWKCYSRVNRVDRSMLERMHRTGCRAMSYGLESGSDEMLKKIRKQIDKDGVREAIQWCSEIGIEATGSFVFGFPWDTRETMRETIQFALELPLTRTFCNIATPYPKTGLWDWAISKGISEEKLYAFDSYLQGFGDFLAEGLEKIFTFELENVSRSDVIAACKYTFIHTHSRYALREWLHPLRTLRRFFRSLFVERMGVKDSLRASLTSTKIFVYFVFRSFLRRKGLKAKAVYIREFLKILFTPLSKVFPDEKQKGQKPSESPAAGTSS